MLRCSPYFSISSGTYMGLPLISLLCGKYSPVCVCPKSCSDEADHNQRITASQQGCKQSAFIGVPRNKNLPCRRQNIFSGCKMVQNRRTADPKFSVAACFDIR